MPSSYKLLVYSKFSHLGKLLQLVTFLLYVVKYFVVSTNYLFLFRFTLYNMFYKRILVVWIVTAFIILIGILLGTHQPGSMLLFGLGIAWLILNAAAIFLCMWVKLKVKIINKQFLAIWDYRFQAHFQNNGFKGKRELIIKENSLYFIDNFN